MKIFVLPSPTDIYSKRKEYTSHEDEDANSFLKEPTLISKRACSKEKGTGSQKVHLPSSKKRAGNPPNVPTSLKHFLKMEESLPQPGATFCKSRPL